MHTRRREANASPKKTVLLLDDVKLLETTQERDKFMGFLLDLICPSESETEIETETETEFDPTLHFLVSATAHPELGFELEKVTAVLPKLTALNTDATLDILKVR